MHRLFVMRHAKSSWNNSHLSDHDRPLAPRGVQAAAALADHVATIDPPPSLVLCSTARRAQDTLEPVRAQLPDTTTVLVEDDLYRVDGPVNLGRMASLIDAIPLPGLAYPPFVPGTPERLRDSADLLATIRQRDVLLHHPFESFDPVVEFIRREMVSRGRISPNDPGLYRIADDVERADAEIEGFYRVYHSQRYLRDVLVLRLRRMIAPEALRALNTEFGDLLSALAEQWKGPLPGEGDELPDLPRLVLPYNRTDFARLRSLLDLVNAS